MNYKTEDGIFAQIAGGLGSSVILVRVSCNFEGITRLCEALQINTERLKPNFTFLSKIYKNSRPLSTLQNLQSNDGADFIECKTSTASQKAKGEFLDEALITYFKAPHSFTGEDCLEIAIHGSPFIFEELVSVFALNGFRFASCGEFSYRAFLNGKIDLVEAEGIASLVASSTKIQHLSAKRQFLGESSIVFNQLRDGILEVLSSIESLIDFSDEELPLDVSSKLELKVEEVKQKIDGYLKNTSMISLKEGLKIAIIGEPNVGKSSIFNTLCKKEKAIVSSIPGTTRDVLEERIVLKGIPLYFYDTAGIRKSSDEIEMEGVRRAVEVLLKSDIKLLIKSVESEKSFKELATDFNLKIDENTIFVLNKIDKGVKSFETNTFCISAKTGEGFDLLIKEVERLLEKNFLPLINEGIIATERQKQMLNLALESLNRFNLHKDIELAGEDLRIASKLLEGIVGKIDVEDILGSIFSKFCIGK